MLELSKIKALPRQVRGTKNKLDFLRVFFKLINHPNDTLLVFELQEQLLKNATLEQRLAGRHLKQHHTKSPDIGALIHRLPSRLLRRHIGGRTHNHSRLGRRCHRRRVFVRLAVSPTGGGKVYAGLHPGSVGNRVE